jgi:selenium-binding protein 1
MNKLSITKVLLIASALIITTSIAWGNGKSESPQGFTAGIKIEVDGDDYYLPGPVVGPNGEKDVPGHEWKLESDNRLSGRHLNSGPNGAPQWWSSDAEDGELLYEVEAVIDTWDLGKAADYAANGFVHYHELERVSDGVLHPTKVVWLKHTAATEFTLDGGPRPDLSHRVNKGLDWDFMNNFLMPYVADSDYVQGISLDIDGEIYYLAGPKLGPNGEPDVPGHEWVQVLPDTLFGRHLNSGPDNTQKWWSSDAEDGALLFTVEAIIDTWSTEKADSYVDRGFVHYHELVNAATGENHPDKVLWLKHAAVDDFNFDRGPRSDLGHMVERGIDLNFMPNAKMPYSP